MTAFYNDPETFRWLSELIAAGEIMRGPVHTGSIADLRGDDLAGFTRVHLFAGIGGWDLALQIAGWPEDAEVWTGSCPCQPFSTAGKRKGTTDDRHLWPEMRRLIAERSPTVVFGEQVASRAGRGWLAGVRADLEELGYAVAAADLCAAGEGAPHIRQRLYWGAVRMGDADSGRRQQPTLLWRQWQASSGAPRAGGAVRLGDSERARLEGYAWNEHDRDESRRIAARSARPAPEAGGAISASAWADCRVIVGADGKARRIEPGIEPLADGIPAGMVPSGAAGVSRYVSATQQARKKRIAGYGNAIVPQLAAVFISAFMASI